MRRARAAPHRRRAGLAGPRAAPSCPPSISEGAHHYRKSVSALFGALATQAVLLRHVVEVLPVHLRFARGGADVAVMASEEPLHVALLELRVVLRARLAVALLGLEVECGVG